jgi:uncharacterized protein with HEPN domain
MKDDAVYLDHILDCIAWIARHTAEGKAAFFADRKTQSAVLRELQTLAQSAQRLSDPVKQQHPEVPWQAVAGFRNVLVHDYLGINFERVWEILEQDLPLLKTAVETMKREASSP